MKKQKRGRREVAESTYVYVSAATRTVNPSHRANWKRCSANKVASES